MRLKGTIQIRTNDWERFLKAPEPNLCPYFEASPRTASRAIKFFSATSAWPDSASRKMQKQRAVGRSLSAILFTLFQHGGSCRRPVFAFFSAWREMKGAPAGSGSRSPTLGSCYAFVKWMRWRMKRRAAKASVDAPTQAAASRRRRSWTSAGRNFKSSKKLQSKKLKVVHWVSVCRVTPLHGSRPSLGRFGLAEGSNHLHGCIVLLDERKVAAEYRNNLASLTESDIITS